METVFAARTTYNEQMYYHMAVAGQIKEPVKKKKSLFEGISMTEVILAPVMFVVFFLTFSQFELSLRLGQSVIATLLTLLLLMFINKRKNSAKIKKTTGQKKTELCKNQAKTMLESGGLSGVRCSVTFGEDCFLFENPGITTEYRYDGIAWIKETSKYYFLYWNRTMAIAVEKAGFYKGRPEQFASFIERKCGKTIEQEKVSA